MAGYDFKSEEEVKEYLKNLHIEYKFGCYSEKKPEACHLLGDYTEAITTDFKKAGIIYQSACDDYKYGKSCSKYGKYLIFGRGCEKDGKKGFEYLRKGCDLNDEKGCHLGGAAAAMGQEIGETDKVKQIETGINMLKKSCYEKNYEKSCFFLSGIYLSGIEGIVDKNQIEAYKLSLKCCEQRNPYACANVSMMHARGEGAQKNPELADVFKRRASELLKETTEQQPQLKFHRGIKS